MQRKLATSHFMTILPDIAAITTLHDKAIIRWKAGDLSLQQHNFLKLVEENHLFNFKLWQTEDCARRDDCGFEYVYKAKRAIDSFNQQRNNKVEAIDDHLFEALSPISHLDCPVHSETPGMMIDRLSILSLKIYHMHEQTERLDVEREHLLNCQQKLITLEAQRQQLGKCLVQLCSEVVEKTRTFRLYKQFKMYNDPNLNPELYKKQVTLEV